MTAKILATMNCNIQLNQVEFIPKVLEEGKLYMSERFKVAAHICPCGCGTKIVTPISPCEWSISVENGKPTLEPSIGNWQIPCKSHYWIDNGQIRWSDLWTDEEIEAGRNKEKVSLELYFQEKANFKKASFWKRVKKWIQNILSK